MKTRKIYFLLSLCLLIASLSYSQPAQNLSKGQIIYPASHPASVMNPDGNAYVTQNGQPFPSQNGYYVNNFEVKMYGIPKLGGDATNDNVGQPCGITDLIPDSLGYSVYARRFRDTDNNIMFRFRVGNNNPSVEAWTILLDVDGKFGYTGPSADPNATADNPGFELDITMIKRSNAGIFIYNIDGTSNCTTPLANYPISGAKSYFQIAVADITTCGDLDYFYDYYVPFNQVASLFNAATANRFALTGTTPLRYASVTNTSATCAMDGKIADVSGIDDSDPQYSNISDAFVQIINSQCGTPIDDLWESGPGFNTELPYTPTINAVKAGDVSVSGTVLNSGTNSGSLPPPTGIFVRVQVFSSTGVLKDTKVAAVTNGVWSTALSSGVQLAPLDKIRARVQLNVEGTGCGTGQGNEVEAILDVPPVGNDDSFQTNEDTPLVNANVATNDVPSDILAKGGVYSNVTNPANGTLVFNANGTFTYSPNLNFNGTDQFVYKLCVGLACDNTTTVTINVLPVNDAPVATSQSVTTPEDTPITITLTGTDVDGPTAFTYTILTQPTNGTLSCANCQTPVYTPNPNYFGPDSFTFRVNDGSLNSAPATVSITITSVNDIPVANNLSVTTPEDTPVGITLSATDLETATLNYIIVTQPLHGTLTGTGANLTYTPTLNYAGPDSFTYKVNDGSADSNTATVTITVTPVNDAPVANSQSLTTPEDTPLPVTLTATDPDGDALTYSVVTAPRFGTLSGSGTNLVYTPNANFNGSDSFTFKANDGTFDSNIATIFITVTPVADAPIANNQTITTDEDTPVSFTLNASDPDGSPLTYTILTNPANGTLTGTAPNLTYTPNANFTGTNTFTYKVNDGTSDSNTATVTIIVNPVNDAPVAQNQNVIVQEDTPTPITLVATDADGDPLTFVIVNQPLHGTLSAIVGTGIVYTPALNYIGPDSFRFRAFDGVLSSISATVSITVVGANDAPIANNQTVTTNEDTPVSFVLSASDVDADPLTYIVLSGPSNGSLTGTAPNLTYIPAANFTGTDSFTYRVNDGTVNSNIATVTIIVNPVNDAPVAQNQGVIVPEDTPTAITLVATDVDGNPLTYTIVTQPLHGTLTAVSGAGVTYTPALDYVGPDSFTFRANDGTLNSNIATVSITVVAINDAPVANNQNVVTNEDTPVSFVLSASDVDADPLTYTILTGPANGTLTGTAPNLTYSPAANFNGTDSFTYRVNDGTVNSNIATVTITVNPVNDAPVAANVNVVVPEDTATDIFMSGSDVDGNPLTYVIVTQPAHGTLSGLTGNKVTYTPDANYFGPDSYTYQVNDGIVNSNIATVFITVTPANDTPVADNQSVTVIEDTPKAITLTASDVDGDALTYSIVTPPAHGTLSAISGTQVTYTPDVDYTGPDSFTFRVNDGTVFSAAATVSITVTPVNDAPIAFSQIVKYQTNTFVDFTLQAFDSETPVGSLTYTVLTNPAVGTISGTAPALRYTPALGDKGTYTLTFKVTDGDGVDSGIATVTLVWDDGSPNAAPVADDQTVILDEDTNKSITITATDPDGDALTYTIVTGPSHGTLTATADPRVYIYTPAANYNGSDSFTFRASDGTLTDDGIVSITVNPINDAPVAFSQTVQYTVNGNTVITLTGSDVDGDPITFSIVSNPTRGTLSGTGNTVTYTPNLNYTGIDNFTFKVTDDKNVDSNVATVSLTASTANNAPVAQAQSVTTPEDTPVTINLSGFDVDGNSLTYSIVTPPAHGTLSCSNCANPVYTPALNYNGPDSFTYKVNDGNLDSAPATVSITVTPLNDAPVAFSQTVQYTVNGNTVITLTGSDPDGDPITFSIVSNPTRGTLSGSGNTVTYSPDLNYNGLDNFTFKVTDDKNVDSNVATVSLVASTSNNPPVAQAQSVTTPEDTPVTINLSGFDVDGNSLTYSIVTPPAHGTLSCNNCANPVYTPALNYNGPDSFTYKVNDGTVDSAPATVSITVTPVQDAPIANNQNVTVTEDVAKAITLTGSDPDNDAITFTVLTQPQFGTLTGTEPNLIYTPNTDYNGPDSFSFRVTDSNNAGSNTATVAITVTPVNDAPVATFNCFTTNEDQPVVVNLKGRDTDGDQLTYVVVTPPIHGTLSCLNCQNPVYTPNPNYNGTDDIFTFKVNDGTTDSNLATICMTVLPVNDAPVANSISVVVQEDQSKDFVLTGSDVEGDALTFTVLTQPLHGTLVVNGANITYTPELNYNGPDSFTFKANDGTVDSGTGTVTINVTPVNDSPVASNTSITTDEDVPVTFSVITNVVDIDGTIDPTTIDLDPSTPAEDKTLNVPGEGVYTADNTGNVTFTPALNYNGTTTPITYTVKDNNGALSNGATIQVIVLPVNDPPVVVNETKNVDEDTPTTICVTVTDVEGDPAVLTGAVSKNGNGVVVLDPTSGQLCFRYSPNQDFNGSDQVEVTVCDANTPGLCTTGVITININPVNDPPRIIVGGQPVGTITLTTPEDTPLNFCFDADDLENDNISVGTITNVSGGGTLVPGAGSVGNTFCFLFTPAQNFTGKATWTVSICDDGNPSLCKEVTIEIDVTPVNDAPVAQDQSVTVVEDTPKAITLVATDPDGDALAYSIVTNPTKGTLSGTGANLVYTPSLNYNGLDSFTFRANDGQFDSNVATVTIDVTPVNDAPVVVEIPTLTVPEDSVLQICIGASDIEGNELTYSNPVNISGGGTMTRDNNFPFCFNFSPPKDFNGESKWKFTVCDNGTPSMCTEKEITIVVTPVNDAPVAVNDFIEAMSFKATDPVNILANDIDIENDRLILTTVPVAGPYHGTVTMNADGNFVYRSAQGYMGTDSVRYKVCDTGSPSLCDEGVVFINVGPAPFKIYNGFSPNGDGPNDYWRIDGIEAYPDNTVRVFDRYNNLIFEMKGYNNEENSWKGQANHSLLRGNMSEGTYYYVVNLGDGSEVYTGYVVLKRN